jgi:hypothetical protein
MGTVVLPRLGLKAASRKSRAVLKPSQAAVTALALRRLWPKMALTGFKRLKPWLRSRFGSSLFIAF